MPVEVGEEHEERGGVEGGHHVDPAGVAALHQQRQHAASVDAQELNLPHDNHPSPSERSANDPPFHKLQYSQYYGPSAPQN